MFDEEGLVTKISDEPVLRLMKLGTLTRVLVSPLFASYKEYEVINKLLQTIPSKGILN